MRTVYFRLGGLLPAISCKAVCKRQVQGNYSNLVLTDQSSTVLACGHQVCTRLVAFSCLAAQHKWTAHHAVLCGNVRQSALSACRQGRTPDEQHATTPDWANLHPAAPSAWHRSYCRSYCGGLARRCVSLRRSGGAPQTCPVHCKPDELSGGIDDVPSSVGACRMDCCLTDEQRWFSACAVAEGNKGS